MSNSSNEGNNLLVPTTLNFNNGVKEKKSLLNSGSATGNPRNKCALKPGHSLMDWIRLGQSGKDLTGTGGRRIPVTREELAKHNKRDDAWMAIRGAVFNVTAYMDYHPGGIDEIMRGVGKDATQLFTEVHAWVNYQQLLQKCYIGPLKHSNKILPPIMESLEKPKENFTTPLKEIMPRFDWTQTANALSLSVYTRKFCNPGFLIKKCPQDHQLDVWILMDLSFFQMKFKFLGDIQWPPKNVQVSTESGKLEITFYKSESNKSLWLSLGEQQMDKLQLKEALEILQSLEYHVMDNRKFNHDSWQLTLLCNNVILIIPLGYHINLTHNENNIEKSYTPVPQKYLSNQSQTNNFCTLAILYKCYCQPQSFTNFLSNQQIDDAVKVSLPQGNFQLSKVIKHRNLCFLAAGSGITPFLALIDHLLKRQTNRIELLYLYYFNKTLEDIWCHDILQQLSQKDERFKYMPLLTRADNNWCGLKGHISTELLQMSSNKCFTYVAACGPQGFNAKVEDIVKQLELSRDDFYIF